MVCSLSYIWHVIYHIHVAGRGTPSRSRERALSNTRKWIIRGDTHADEARDFIGKRRPGGEQQGKGTQENCSATWLAVSGFMVMGLVSGLSLANHSDSGSFLVAHASLSQDGFQWEGFWEVVRTWGLATEGSGGLGAPWKCNREELNWTPRWICFFDFNLCFSLILLL